MRIASHIRGKIPDARIIIWNDMMNNLPDYIVEKYVSFKLTRIHKK